MYNRAIYWFKRDLRIDDNKAFWQACQNSKELIPVFIFIPALLQRFKSYDSRLGFIVEGIKYLSKQIKKIGGRLFCYHEEPMIIFHYLIDKYKPEAIFTNKAFSWTGEEIERKIEKLCKDKDIAFHNINDNFLGKISEIPYKKIYSAFYKKWKENLNLTAIPPPERIITPKIKEPEIFNLISNLNYHKNFFWKIDFAFKRIDSFDFLNYENTRDKLDTDGTSKLSPYIRFGIISLRKLYKKVQENAGDDCQFIKELAWREFWYHIKFNFPEFNKLEFQEKHRNMKWEYDEKLFNAFINAQTGYPLIDASIIQLKQEGWMHNRARMIVANFLTKDLLIDWRIGEKFFMEYLLDYDEVVNTGNWQWNASVGPDPKPLRIFNPIIQAKKFDPNAFFIKKYLPELKNTPVYALHDPINYKLKYYKPIVNHYERIIFIKRLYLKNFRT
ncbi:MAG: DNA photolyase family protein [Thermodesulfovibrio sp.]|nr:DNA photolyase family protein [Thermodesulfovibrio sp.]